MKICLKRVVLKREGVPICHVLSTTQMSISLETCEKKTKGEERNLSNLLVLVLAKSEFSIYSQLPKIAIWLETCEKKMKKIKKLQNVSCEPPAEILISLETCDKTCL